MRDNEIKRVEETERVNTETRDVGASLGYSLHPFHPYPDV